MTPEQTRIVNEAKKHLGKPYVWGGKGPDSFDCSGLVQYVFKQALGIILPPSTILQETYGKEVSLTELLPGDILFYGTRGQTYHDAIYIGNGLMIHAPKPGETVTTLEMKYFMPDFARRLLSEAVVPDPQYVKSDFLASIKGNNIKLWNNLEGTNERRTTTNGQVFNVTGLYQYRSGEVVYSLYNQDGSWAGYVNAKFAIQVKYTTFGKEVVVNRSNVNVYSDLYCDTLRNSTSEIIGKIFEVRGFYTLGNGDKVYSLYDKEGKWHGYLNSKAASTIAYYAQKQLVSISVEGQSMWNDLSLTKVRDTTTGKLGKAYNETAYYIMENGAKIISIYNQDGSWAGYIDSKYLINVVYTAFNKEVVISKSGYYSYSDFFFSSRKISTADYMNKSFIAQGFYVLGNGRKYYTLYDASGKWYGYLNSDATVLK
ncbi:C40 family peptidase [Candidatus Enterococcus willemsii]|uniref:NlpC/P60 domain-containing protein n=1 Tax=Candidatus Enterococcus willemsii TaxID=1857215 RepID=A0ABQ6Z239_9ENTE|nr:C40 family peptidase [Enterococcus sp. CU12B]KAF1305417.1 hypothetical protein BAU17_02690 [Enterococcus sp. CU12B]